MNRVTMKQTYPRVSRTINSWVTGWNKLGRQTQFYGWTIKGVWDAVVHYRAQVLRLIAQTGLGTGALAIIGGTVVIIGFLTLTAGSTLAAFSYQQLTNVGIDALMGFTSAFINIRLLAPLIAGIGLVATIGASATAQLGAMRISEEIDALEVMGIRTVPYLASARLVAGLVVVVPLYCIAVLMAILATRTATTIGYGQSAGVYDHYFNTFLNPSDLLWSLFQAVVMAFIVMLV
ncbi:MAG: ABC transporter permease, partial [Mycobacterium sp.]